MPSTHLSLHYHLVFSTKNRELLIADSWRQRLHAFLGGALRAIGGVPEIVGGTADHVHALAGLKATHRLADVLREIKASSSKWAHEDIKCAAFQWQDGYGAFTVSASKRDEVKAYIIHQAEHHHKRSFEEEYVELLKKSGVEYDPRYLW
ncbi:MAG: transposase [Planctomycetota bacterium]|nr:transposase [Planctomycetota bacterium]